MSDAEDEKSEASKCPGAQVDVFRKHRPYPESFQFLVAVVVDET